MLKGFLLLAKDIILNVKESIGYFVSSNFGYYRNYLYLTIKKTLLLQKFLKVFVREWCYTTNHKKLGLNYLLFAAISGLFGTTLSTLIRMELAQPGSLVFSNNANAYHVVMAMHAIIMVFFLVTPLFISDSAVR